MLFAGILLGGALLAGRIVGQAIGARLGWR